MFKKNLLLLFAVLLCIALFALSAAAETNGKYQYEPNDTQTGIVITGYVGTDTALTLPGKINDLLVTGIADNAFRNCYILQKVSIPACITVIGDGAFAGCESLTSVSFGGDPDSIGVFAFDRCEKLQLKSSPGTLVYSYAKQYGIPVSAPGNGLEYSLRGELLTVVGYSGEGGVVTVPQTQVFNGKSYRVTYIGDEAFSGVRNVTEIRLSSSVEDIGYNAFFGCAELESVVVDMQNDYYCSEDGVLYNKDQSVLLCYPAAKKDESFAVPSSVMEIGYHAFFGNHCLKTVTVGESVNTVGYYAFADCSALTDIDVSDSLLYVGVGAFRNTAWMNAQADNCIYIGKVLCEVRDKTETIVLAEDVKALSAYAFDGAPFETIDLPETLEVIHTGAFRNCSALRSISLPGSVASMKAFAFAGCTSLRDAYFSGDGINMEKKLFGNLRSVLFHCETDTDAYYFATDYQFALAEIDLPIPYATVSQIRRATMTASWEPVNGATGYNVYLKNPSSSSYKKVTSSPVTGTEYTFTKLAASSNYSFYVTSVDASDPGSVRESYVGTYVYGTTLNGVLGDVDQDGALTLKDMIAAFQHVAGSIVLDESACFVADVDYDEKVTLSDVIMIFRAVSGSITLK